MTRIYQLNDFQHGRLQKLATGTSIAYCATDINEMADLDDLVKQGLMQDATEAMHKRVSMSIPWKAYALTETGLRLYHDLDSQLVN